jgi:urease accessory protein
MRRGPCTPGVDSSPAGRHDGHGPLTQKTVTNDPATLPAASAPPWHATLALRFVRGGSRTELASSQHGGPLRLQRVLHPAAGGCEALLLHPPGGIAGGDTLQIDVRVEPGADVLLSTPGAGKWYRSAGRAAHQHVTLRVARGALLEWLPQEAILFRGADAVQTLQIHLAADAGMIGWDIVQLGRIAAGEAWDAGRFRQTLCLCRDGVPVWREHADFAADDALLDAPTGLAGQRVFGTLWASGPGLADPDAQLAAVREALAASSDPDPLQFAAESEQSLCCAAATWLAAPVELLLVRVLANDAERARAQLEAAWAALRPTVIGRKAQRPRIWST